MAPSASGLTRRETLGAIATGGIVSVAGCSGLFGNSNPDFTPLELTVTAPPSDEDPAAAEIGRRLTEHLDEIGVNAAFSPRIQPQFTSDIHFEGNFDIFISRSPRITGPESLQPLIHSDYAEASGDWLNPFQFEDPIIDARLDRLRTTTGESRQLELDAIQETLAIEHLPFAVIAAHEELTAVSESLTETNRPSGVDSSSDVLSLGLLAPDESPDHLRIGLLDGGITQNLNPLNESIVAHAVTIGLLYDPLLRKIGELVYPWAAQEVAWELGAQPPVAEIVLRADLTWHDGEPVVAEDVLFTYTFLADLAGGADTRARPAALYAPATSLIDTVEITDEDRIRFTFTGQSRPVVEQALRVPLLPQHIWSTMTGLTEDGHPQALFTDNLDPIGSGPYILDEIQPGERVDLSRHDEHVSFSPDTEAMPIPPHERISFIVPTHPPTVGAATNLVSNNELDIIAKVPHDGLEAVFTSEGVTLETRPSQRRYIVGFNTASEPCDDAALRRVIARFIDRTYTVASVFRGFGSPADSLFINTPYAAASLEWTGSSVLGRFPGAGGFIDVDIARELLVQAGYPYDSDADTVVNPRIESE